ncbi:MAG: cytochrome P450 [Pseudomonadota bacterium]
MKRPLHRLSPLFSSHEYQAMLYEYYKSYQHDTPVICNEDGSVYVTHYADCLHLLNSPSCKREAPNGGGPFSKLATPTSALEKMIRHWMVFMDPPRHDLVRKAFASAFLAKPINRMEPMIRARVRQLLEQWPATGNVEAIQQLAFPLPVMVIADILGVPEQDGMQFQSWALQLTEALDTAEEASIHRGEGVALELKAYFEHLVATRNQLPEHCLINTVENTADSKLTAEEYVYGYAFLLWAGHETTKNLIANGILTLIQHPVQLAQLQQEPALLESAIEEILRYECPVQKISRWTHEDVSFGEYLVPAGTLVTALIGAANRDPATFEHPDQFDITRSKNRHIAFGTGIHHCLGALLARTEARIVLGELLPRLQHLTITDYQWRTFSAFRSLERLHLNVGLPC